MSKRKEKISAFLDDGLHRDEIMSFSLSAEADDAETVQRYQMVGDVLRGEMSNASFIDVSHAVREALASENVADEIDVVSIGAAEAAVTIPDNKAASAFDWSSWFRPVAGMAVAASVVVVMVSVLSEGDVTPAINNSVASNNEQPVVRVAVDKEPNDNKAINLDPYINQHLEFATQDALQDRLPYVRAVGFEPNRPSVPEKTQPEKTQN